MKILVVDDEVMYRQSIGEYLHGRGHEVWKASDGGEALRLMDASPVDMVLSDIQMPEMDGIAFLKQVREQNPSLPVILMTAYATADTAIAALRSRAYDYLKKPFQLAELQGCIDRIEKNGKTR